MIIKDLSSKRIDLIDLVEIGKDGLADMHEYSIKPEFYEFLTYDPFKTIEDTSAYIDKLIKRSSLETGHYWFIRLNKSNKIIGTFGLMNIDLSTGSTEIGYGLSPDYWGGGYFTETLTAVVKYLFLELNFHRIWAKTQSNNIASIKSLNKCGFQKEGVLRDFYFSSEGIRYDATILSILRDEFYNCVEDESL